jgi:pilus assembly protein Flp/PilA
MLKRFFKDERGATAIEYAMITGLIFLALVTVLYTYRDSMHSMYDHIGTAVTGATPAAG